MKHYRIYYTLIISFVVLLSVSCTDMHKSYDADLVEYPAPELEDFSPKEGRPQTPVIFTGSKFGEYPEAATVTFNGVPADTIINYSDTEFTAVVPEGAGSGPVNVKVWTHSVTAQDEFTFVPGAELNSISSESPMPGDILTITGSNFGEDRSIVEVQISGTVAEIVSLTDTEIQVRVPEVSSGILQIFVGSQELGGQFLLIGEEFLTGTIFGHESSWGDNPDTYVDAAFDGDTGTFVDGPNSVGWVGYDLGEGIAAEVTRIRYYPRESHPGRMDGGEFRGSNSSNYRDEYTVLHTIEGAPPIEWSEIEIENSESYRYIYYYSSDGNGNVAELEFYGIVD